MSWRKAEKAQMVESEREAREEQCMHPLLVTALWLQSLLSLSQTAAVAPNCPLFPSLPPPILHNQSDRLDRITALLRPVSSELSPHPAKKLTKVIWTQALARPPDLSRPDTPSSL